MRLSAEKMPVVAKEFVMTYLLPKVPSVWVQFLVFCSEPYLERASMAIVNNLLPGGRLLTVVEEDGCVDLDLMKTAIFNALEKVGGRVNLYGIYTADRADFEKFFEIAQRHV